MIIGETSAQEVNAQKNNHHGYKSGWIHKEDRLEEEDEEEDEKEVQIKEIVGESISHNVAVLGPLVKEIDLIRQVPVVPIVSQSGEKMDSMQSLNEATLKKAVSQVEYLDETIDSSDVIEEVLPENESAVKASTESLVGATSNKQIPQANSIRSLLTRKLLGKSKMANEIQISTISTESLVQETDRTAILNTDKNQQKAAMINTVNTQLVESKLAKSSQDSLIGETRIGQNASQGSLLARKAMKTNALPSQNADNLSLKGRGSVDSLNRETKNHTIQIESQSSLSKAETSLESNQSAGNKLNTTGKTNLSPIKQLSPLKNVVVRAEDISSSSTDDLSPARQTESTTIPTFSKNILPPVQPLASIADDQTDDNLKNLNAVPQSNDDELQVEKIEEEKELYEPDLKQVDGNEEDDSHLIPIRRNSLKSNRKKNLYICLTVCIILGGIIGGITYYFLSKSTNAGDAIFGSASTPSSAIQIDPNNQDGDISKSLTKDGTNGAAESTTTSSIGTTFTTLSITSNTGSTITTSYTTSPTSTGSLGNIIFQVQPLGTHLAGSPIPNSPVVLLETSNGYPIAGVNITLTAYSSAGCIGSSLGLGILGNYQTVTDSTGYANFVNLTYTKAENIYLAAAAGNNFL